eukprot:CAMPEP_0119043740 /NCGR_PEP_ID=MMETSP1177-20130426/25389_1 /TAXON_ID=2985 /ORGANISM="Ochromonas sp, Strain CCMP1899" /LENGTH=142 /DNA_ID=CAMNT_0007012511 /DNA_START=1 /DNA_END=429 /DNA_ORIENTATION=+
MIITLFLLVSCFTFVASEKDWNLKSFQENVLSDDRVWIVEFYSSMCGSCKEFSSIWEKVDSSLKSIATAKINIDDTGGMEVAKHLKVLEEGIPNVRVFHKNKNTGTSIVKGDNLSYKEVMTLIKSKITGLTKRVDGFYLKSV